MKNKCLVGEPFTNRDGVEVAIYDFGGPLIRVSLDHKTFFYGKDDIAEAGQGDMRMGIVRLGQVANQATAETTHDFAVRPLLTMSDGDELGLQ